MKSQKHNANDTQKRREAPREMLGINTSVTTKDGPGKVVGYSQRENTNGGPGCRQYVVRLDDGRVRHYNQVMS